MTYLFSRRTRLLSGVSAIVILLGSPAFAQTVDANAARAAVNRQATSGPMTVDNDRSSTLAQIGAVHASDASVAGNSILSSARANVADTGLDGEQTPLTGTASASSLSVAGQHVTAAADRLVASSQTMTHAPVQSLALRSDVGIEADAASSAKLAVAGNNIAASALGNQATDTLSLANADMGGAIVSVQSGDAASGVSALNTGAVRISAAAASDSAFDLSGNQAGADATGNRVDDALSINAGSVRVADAGASASLVPTASGAPASVDALYVDLGTQTMSGKVAATVGVAPATFDLDVTGALAGSNATVEGNALSANATANRASHALDLRADGIASDGTASNIANVTNVQRALGGDLVAATNGGTRSDIGGPLSGSTLDVSRNAQSAAAFANRATGNLLTVHAATIDTSGSAVPAPDAAGMAAIGSDGAASTSAAFSVQNVQATSGVSAIATMTANKVGVEVGGAVDGSAISADANDAASAATANSAINGVAIDGGTIRSSVGVNNSQTVDGQLRSNVGDFTNRAGVTITPASSVAAATLHVTGNGLTGSTIGNNASNSLTIAAAALGNVSGHNDAIAGSLDNGYGAAADIALSNYQKLGQPVAAGAEPSGLATTIVGAFGVGGDGPINTSVLDVSGNSQSAAAVGNAALDRISLGAANASATGSALTSSQSGDGTVTATSDMQVLGRSALDTSSMTMSANTNQAVAAMNDADNGLAISAAGTGSAAGEPARAEVGNLGAATIAGDHVLANQQFASGSVAATARTTFPGGDADATMTGSRLDVSDNSALADASANHAINAVSVGGTTATGSEAGLGSSQMNAAAVAANSDMAITPGLTGSAAPIVYGSTATIGGNSSEAVARGNSADNAVTVSSVGDALSGAAASLALGAFQTEASAPALLVNGQSNYGAITARAGGVFALPLNASDPVSSSTLGVAGNSVAASAYGNAATNKLAIAGLGATPAAMLVNIQSNTAPVTASVIGSNAGLRTGALVSSAMAITGNQLAATAVGNLATNAVSGGR